MDVALAVELFGGGAGLSERVQSLRGVDVSQVTRQQVVTLLTEMRASAQRGGEAAEQVSRDWASLQCIFGTLGRPDLTAGLPVPGGDPPLTFRELYNRLKNLPTSEQIDMLWTAKARSALARGGRMVWWWTLGLTRQGRTIQSLSKTVRRHGELVGGDYLQRVVEISAGLPLPARRAMRHAAQQRLDLVWAGYLEALDRAFWNARLDEMFGVLAEVARKHSPESGHQVMTLGELYNLLKDLPVSEQRAILREARERWGTAPAPGPTRGAG